MTVRTTSLEAYEAIKQSGITGQQSIKILKWLADNGTASRSQVSVGTGIAINAVCGRVNELIKLNMIQEGDKIKCPVSGRMVYGITGGSA